MRAGLVLILIAGCGGAQGKRVDEGPREVKKTPCVVTASHVADAVFTWKEPPPTSKESVAQVITERCEQDQWTAEAVACFGKITDEESAKPCVQTLTKEQHDKVMNAMEARFDHKSHHRDDNEGGSGAHHGEEGKMGGTRGIKPASAPPPAPPPPSKGGPAKGADPCEGGE